MNVKSTPILHTKDKKWDSIF